MASAESFGLGPEAPAALLPDAEASSDCDSPPNAPPPLSSTGLRGATGVGAGAAFRAASSSRAAALAASTSRLLMVPACDDSSAAGGPPLPVLGGERPLVTPVGSSTSTTRLCGEPERALGGAFAWTFCRLSTGRAQACSTRALAPAGVGAQPWFQPCSRGWPYSQCPQSPGPCPSTHLRVVRSQRTAATML